MDATRERDYLQGQAERNTDGEDKETPMGDKGGKKDKMKDQKQKAVKKQQEAKEKVDKQRPKKPAAATS
jgi:hypothetical protein